MAASPEPVVHCQDPTPRPQPQRDRIAVIIVHGMGEQKPRETVNSFVSTALTPIADSLGEAKRRIYYSRPTALTDSFEARVLLAIEREPGHPVSQKQTDFFEYHWSYLLTGNAIGDLVPLIRRLMLRWPWHVPCPLLLMWALLWGTILAFGFYMYELAPDELRADFSVDKLVSALFPNAIWAALVGLAIFVVIAKLTSHFVDVARYVDTSPRSYDVRRAIRGGMVDLLKRIQDSGHYERVIVVAHSLGAFIAYDGMTSLWNSQTARMTLTFESLAQLQTAAGDLPALSSKQAATDEQLQKWREAQSALWREMRDQGLSWLVTDFISVGTPMYLADLLLTGSRKKFIELCRRSELPQCPPLSDTEVVENDTAKDDKPDPPTYGWRGERRLVTGSPFAVVRWTNLWFPSAFGFFGDWFGGKLRLLFGSGIRDIPVTGNRRLRKGASKCVPKSRFIPALAHTYYFNFPVDADDGDIAKLLRDALALNIIDGAPVSGHRGRADPPSPASGDQSSRVAGI